MARIRTTKPEFYTSEQVMGLSVAARYAFQGLWCFCDDGGNHPASAKTLKAEIFPSDEITAAQVQSLVDEMIAQGLVVVYEVAGKQYWHVTGWHHQRIDKPTFKYPKFEESYQKPLGPLGDDSSNPPRTLAPVLEGNGEEGSGKGEDSVPDGTGAASAPPVLTESQAWQAGIDLLSKAGMPERRTRTFLGKLARDYGNPALLQAISVAVVAQPVDPAAYIRGACRKQPTSCHSGFEHKTYEETQDGRIPA